MPNWCGGFVTVEGKPKDVEAFCKHFIFTEEEGKENISKQYFARSFMETTWKAFKKDELKTGSFVVNFAWSAYSCLIKGYPNGKQCITLMEACKKHKVNVDITTEEPGMCFEEHISCNDKGKLVVDECTDMPEYKCACGSTQSFATNADVSEETCWECEKEGQWTKVKK